jgi:hypothetical protein
MGIIFCVKKNYIFAPDLVVTIECNNDIYNKNAVLMFSNKVNLVSRSVLKSLNNNS